MKKSTTMASVALAATAALFVAGCSSSSSAPAESASPAASSPMASPMESGSAMAEGTIVEVAVGNPDFSTLVAAVKAAGLTETLSAEGPYTVFAPTNEAFEALPAGTVEKLLKPENKEALTKILTYHVVEGEVLSTDIQPGKVPTLEGQYLTITTKHHDGFALFDSALTDFCIRSTPFKRDIMHEVILKNPAALPAFTRIAAAQPGAKKQSKA